MQKDIFKALCKITSNVSMTFCYKCPNISYIKCGIICFTIYLKLI